VHRENDLDPSSSWLSFTTRAQEANRRSRSVKQLSLLLIAGLVVAGCCSTNYDLQRSPTSDLQLRRYDLKHCLGMNGMSWDKQPLQSNAYSEVQDDFQEKAAIEGEITRRDVTDYHRAPPVTDGYVRDRCHCQEWIVNL